MHIFKDTITVEECPAKTAESVSYRAAFTVLGWLLFSNYSGVGHPELNVRAIANIDLPIINEAPPEVIADTQILNETQNTGITLHHSNIEEEINNFLSTAPVWHTEIKQFERHSHLRAFSTATWGTQIGDAGQQIEGLIEGLDLPLLIDANYLLNAKSRFDTIIIDDLANNQPAKDKLASEIPVTGTETKRLSSRPEDIHRPQIPRPYRARGLQRSFILPPRIQALRH